MKKLLLMIVALSFIAVVPKVASAFTMVELVDPAGIDILWGNFGLVKLDVSQAQIPQFGESVMAEIPDDALNTLSAALSLKSQKNVHFLVADTDANGSLEVLGISIGDRAMPQWQDGPGG